MKTTKHIFRLIILFILCELIISPGIGLAQSSFTAAKPQAYPAAAQTELSTPQLINRALTQGEITAEQRILYLAYAILEYTSLPKQFYSKAGWYGTEFLLEVQNAFKDSRSGNPPPLSEAVMRELERLLSPNDATTICDQPDGPNNNSTSPNFYINYGVITGTLTITDYVISLDTAFKTEVTDYGWYQPPLCDASCLHGPPPDNKYPVQLASLGDGLYGYTSRGGGWYDGYPVGDYSGSMTSCIVLRDDSYASLDGLNSLDVTTTHEFNHAIAWGYGDPAPEDDEMWLEGSAAYMEDEVHDNVNDNYQYLWPDWTNCLGQWPTWPTREAYSSWIWFRYAAEHNGGVNAIGGGEDLVETFWTNIANGISALPAFNNALEMKTPGATLADTFHQYAIASRFMKECPNSDPYCYQESSGYVTNVGSPPVSDVSIAAVPGSIQGAIQDHYSLKWITLPNNGEPYNIKVNNLSASGELRASIVADPTGDRTGTLDISPIPLLLTAGESYEMCYTPPGTPNSIVAVITNQFTSSENPTSCTPDNYSIEVSPASTFTQTELSMGITYDIGCTNVKVKVVEESYLFSVTATKHSEAPGGNPPGVGEMPVYWNIEEVGDNYKLDLTLCFTDEELAAAGAGVTENNLSAYRYDEIAHTWTLVGADERDIDGNCVTVKDIEELSTWTLGDGLEPPTAIQQQRLSAKTAIGTSTQWIMLCLVGVGLAGGLYLRRRFRKWIFNQH